MLEDHDISLLSDLLARTTALFSPPRVYNTDPCRCLPNGPWAARWERIKRFPESGVEVTYGGSALDRKNFERQIGDLQSRGLLKVFTRSGRRVGLRLTDRGDNLARWFCCEPLLIEVWHRLSDIQTLIDAGVCLTRMVSECDLAETSYGDSSASGKLVDLEHELMPLLVRDLVDDHADRQGRVYYALTPAGQAALAQPAPAAPDYLPPYRGDFWERYLELESRHTGERLDWRPEETNRVIIPLSAGNWPTRTWLDLEQPAKVGTNGD